MENLQKENKQLKNQNEELKEDIMKLSEEVVTIFDDTPTEVKKLKHTKDVLWKMIRHHEENQVVQARKYLAQHDELMKSYEKVGKLKEESRDTLNYWKSKCENAEAENKELKEENEKWEYWASEVIHWSHSASKDNLQEKKLITPDNKPTIGDVRDFGEEIKKLKEQLKLERFTKDNDVQIKRIAELEDTVKFYKDQGNKLGEDYNDLMVKNEKLKREFEAFQERVNEVFTKE